MSTEKEWGWQPWDAEAIVHANTFLVEYLVAGREHSRPAIRQYEIGANDVPRRIDPIATNPIDFTEEWDHLPWLESLRWTQDSARAKLAPLHKKYAHVLSTGYGPTMHCRDAPDLWQVDGGAYFIVRWKPPYRFTMVDIRDTPRPLCTEKDPVADQSGGLFFPKQ